MNSQPQNDLLNIDVPAPNEMFLVKTIHASNLDAVRRAVQNRERLLTPKQIKLIKKLRKVYEDQLNAAGYWDKKQQYTQLYQRVIELKVEYRQLADDARINWQEWGKEKRYEVHTRALAIRQQKASLVVAAKQLQHAVSVLHPVARSHRYLMERIEEHEYAIKSRKHQQKQREELRDESHDFAAIIREKLSQLGFKEERQVGKRHLIKKVRFYTPQITPDRVWLKIAASSKGLFGFVPTLPQGAKVTDMISEDTCRELSTAVQRQVQGRYTITNGAWLIINRLGSMDGIMTYLTLSQVLTRYERSERELLPILLGVGEGRYIWKVYLAEHPHMLIGGSTGSGKSNAENVILSTLIKMHSPDEVRFILIDLKEGLELGHYEKIPHLLTPVVTEIDEVAHILGQVEALRKERATELKRYWCRDISEYNNRVGRERRMPHLIIMFDEYAAINVAPDVAKTIQQIVMQLLNKGRATGIHLILCTQNPSVDILPGFSKNNITFRLAGRMPTHAASMTVLGTGEAADLPNIKGRMVAMVGADRWQIQIAHATNEDIAGALDAASEYDKPREIKLPDSSAEVLGFDENRLLEIAFREYGGALKARPIWEYVKEEHAASQKQVETMVKTIIGKKEIEFNGKVYKPKLSRGNFYRLVELVS